MSINSDIYNPIYAKYYRTPDEQLELNFLSLCPLNDFDAFEEYLFTSEERSLPGMERFKKFIHVVNKGFHYAYMDNEYNWTIDVPFAEPKEPVEFQINHYVLWGTIAYRQVGTKPWSFFEFNTGNPINPPLNSCYACEWSFVYKNSYHCYNCPIWDCSEKEYVCESSNDSYYKYWRKTIEDFKLKEYATKLMMAIWEV